MSRVEVNAGILEAECRDIASNCTDVTERIKECMRKAKNHWMIVDEDEQVQAALIAASMHSTEEEQELIRMSLKPNQALQAASQGLPVDWESMLKEIEGMELIPITALWREIKDE